MNPNVSDMLTLPPAEAAPEQDGEKPQAQDANGKLPGNLASLDNVRTEIVTVMELDSSKPSSGRIDKKRIQKRSQKKSSIVFRKHSDRLAAKKKGGK